MGCGYKTQQGAGEAVLAPSAKVVATQQEGKEIAFPVYDFEGFEPLLHQADGKTYVINFWATWCKPCREELPILQAINEKYKDRSDFQIIGISADTEVEVLEKFLDKISMHWILKFDGGKKRQGILSKLYGDHSKPA